MTSNLTGPTLSSLKNRGSPNLATTTVVAKLPEEEERVSLRLALLLVDGGTPHIFTHSNHLQIAWVICLYVDIHVGWMLKVMVIVRE
jgi:hypothetical protein